jgi:hypothetical protein
MRSGSFYKNLFNCFSTYVLVIYTNFYTPVLFAIGIRNWLVMISVLIPILIGKRLRYPYVSVLVFARNFLFKHTNCSHSHFCTLTTYTFFLLKLRTKFFLSQIRNPNPHFLQWLRHPL